jgi:ABC-type transporter Mla subunit MlaD
VIEKHMQDARGFLNEASNSLGLAEEAVNDLQKKAEALGPKAEEYDRLTEKLAAKKLELAAAEDKLAKVTAAHQQFAKLVTG